MSVSTLIPEQYRHQVNSRARILVHLRAAAGPHTKLLVADNLLAYACIDEDSKIDNSGAATGESEGPVRSLVPDGSPLLPNLGRASSIGYVMDISVSPKWRNRDFATNLNCLNRCWACSMLKSGRIARWTHC